jgi:hypothetical protein
MDYIIVQKSWRSNLRARTTAKCSAVHSSFPSVQINRGEISVQLNDSE